MTIQSVIQSACVLLSLGRKTGSVFSSSDQEYAELVELANVAADDIASRHDWSKLLKLATITGDGMTVAFGLPADYDRMPVKSALLTDGYSNSLRKARDLDQWNYFSTNPVIGSPGYWIMLGGYLQILPAFPNGNITRFYYITKNIVSDNKTTFTMDADTFVLDEKLLRLAIIWRWRQMKRLEYAEDMQNFEIALAQEITRDKGATTIYLGAVRTPFGADFPFPGVIAPREITADTE